MTDADLAADLAAAAGRLLLEERSRAHADGTALGAAGDRAANRFLVNALRAARPDDGLLSEEMICDGSRLNRSRVWIIDPLDGTREYGEGRDDWAVHVGLAIDSVAAIGAVALPARDRVLRSDRSTPLPPMPARPRMVVSRTRPPAMALAVARRLNATTIPMGSAGAKAMAVVWGEAEIYLHAGGQNQWDNCAPVAVAQAHGLHCSRIDGGPLVYNLAGSELPDLLICRAELAAAVLAAVAIENVP